MIVFNIGDLIICERGCVCMILNKDFHYLYLKWSFKKTDCFHTHIWYKSNAVTYITNSGYKLIKIK